MSQKKRRPQPAVPTPESSPKPRGAAPGVSNEMMLQQLFDYQRSQPVQSMRAGGIFQELQYPLLHERPGSLPGTTDKYNLSFRDKSGYRGSTSEAFLNKSGPGSKWKGLRLDHGPNVKTNGQTNWHWNQKGAMNAFGRPDHAVASPGTARAAAALRALKPAARGAMLVGAGMDAFSIGQEAHESMQTGDWENTIDQTAHVAGGWAGAYTGAKALGALGAGLGSFILPGIGSMIGGGIGAFTGGALGYWGGSSLMDRMTGKQ